MVNQKALYRAKLAGATLVAGASIGALFLRFSKPREEPIMNLPPVPRPTAPPDCGPEMEDMRCELNKGEADPHSATFDPVSCGYCGDGIRQVTSSTGSRPFLDIDTMTLVQEVTERPSETPENCPVEFHCGNGVQDFRQVYGAWLPPIAVEHGDPVAINEGYTLGTKIITENSRDCPADVKRNGSSRRDAEQETGAREEPGAALPSSYSWRCPALMAPESSDEMVNLHSSSVWSALSRINGAINNNATALRQALDPAGIAGRVDVHLTIRIGPRGHMQLSGISATCDATPCGDSVSIINSTELSLNGLVMGAPGTECYWSLTLHVP
jgi:hypothetical protein